MFHQAYPSSQLRFQSELTTFLLVKCTFTLIFTHLVYQVVEFPRSLSQRDIVAVLRDRGMVGCPV